MLREMESMERMVRGCERSVSGSGSGSGEVVDKSSGGGGGAMEESPFPSAKDRALLLARTHLLFIECEFEFVEEEVEVVK